MIEGIPTDPENISGQLYSIENWTPNSQDFESTTIDIITISEAEYYLTHFPSTTTIVVRDNISGHIIGYSVAELASQVYSDNSLYSDRSPGPDTAFIVKTAISKKHRGKHLTEHVMAELEMAKILMQIKLSKTIQIESS